MKSTGPSGDLGQAVANEVARLKKNAGMSNRELAKRIGVTHPYIGDRLSHAKPFDLNDVARIAEVFGITPVELLTQAEQRSKGRFDASIHHLRAASSDPDLDKHFHEQ